MALTSPRIVCVYAGRRHEPIRSGGRLSDGSPYGLRWREGLCIPFGRIRDSQRYWVVPTDRLLPRLPREPPAGVSHGRDIDNFLSIGIPQAPSAGVEVEHPTAERPRPCTSPARLRRRRDGRPAPLSGIHHFRSVPRVIPEHGPPEAWMVLCDRAVAHSTN